MVASLIGLAVFLLVLTVLSIWTRRTEREMDFEQAEGMAKSDDGLRLGIALSANNSLFGGS